MSGTEKFRARCLFWFLYLYAKLFVVLVTIVGCQQAPTKITQATQLSGDLLLKNTSGPLQVDESTILVDTRAPFEYSVAHAPGAINFQWQDFASPKTTTPGKVTSDLEGLAHRLALHGIAPDAKVVVMGSGKGGMGEEGRVAWSLVHMGVRDVQIASVGHFKTGMTNAEPAQRPNAPRWEPQVNSSMVADRSEVLAAATAKVTEGEPPKARLLDVRSRKEYFLKAGVGQGYVFPDLRALHIPWEQFYNDQGRPDAAIKTRLEELGWGVNDRIIVISQKGVRSGAVAFALMSMGFKNVANFTGGYLELLSTQKRVPKERPPGKRG